MAWHAKPSGAYSLTSTAGEENAREMYNYLTARGYTATAACGVIGNTINESGLNPWRWQSDTYNLSGGYGLFQFTPASGYINGAASVQYYAPNLSTTQQTTGALATDGIAQLYTMDTNLLSKWVSSCWRSYWNMNSYPEQYSIRTEVLQRYGSNNRLSMAEFRDIDLLYYATFAFMACFEGPARPTLGTRYANAVTVYEMIVGQQPTPPVFKRKSLPIWMMLRYHF